MDPIAAIAGIADKGSGGEGAGGMMPGRTEGEGSKSKEGAPGEPHTPLTLMKRYTRYALRLSNLTCRPSARYNRLATTVFRPHTAEHAREPRPRHATLRPRHATLRSCARASAQSWCRCGRGACLCDYARHFERGADVFESVRVGRPTLELERRDIGAVADR